MQRALLATLAALGLTAVGIVVAHAADDKKDAPGKAQVLFNGKDLTGWKIKGNKDKSKWVVGYAKLNEKDPGKLVVEAKGEGPAQLVNAAGGGVDLFSDEKMGDGTLEVELMVPKGSNSGVYVMGEYEVQVLDSFGKEKVGPGDIGGLYGAQAPKMNAAKKPGEWQKFVIEYQAPRFENGKKTAPMKFVKVVLNDQVIHENVEMKGPTPAGVTGKEAAEGTVMFQGDHGPVAYRNIKFTPKTAK
jgi:hypothetical protein